MDSDDDTDETYSDGIYLSDDNETWDGYMEVVTESEYSGSVTTSDESESEDETDNEDQVLDDASGIAEEPLQLVASGVSVPILPEVSVPPERNESVPPEGNESVQPERNESVPDHSRNNLTDKNSPPKEKQSAADNSTEEDGQMCSICFEPWTSSGDHRLSSLKCGHLFGKSCILKWLKGQGSRCPQCNTKAVKSDIRPIFARALKVLDTSERDRALQELEKESERRRKVEIECAQHKLKISLLTQECELLKSKLMHTQLLLNESRFVNKVSEKMNNLTNTSQSSFTLTKNIEIRGGGCRIIDGSDLLGMLLISQPSTNVLFPGFGLKKVSLPDMRVQEFVCLHQKPIKDFSFHPHDSLVLTASLDKTVKLTNCISNSVVQSYNLNGDAWSCKWDLDDPCYFYTGVQNGVVKVFDIRVTDKHVCELDAFGQRSPVVSLSYLKKRPNVAHSTSGLIVGHLASCGFFQKHSSLSYECHLLPLEGRVMSLSCDSATCHLLASFRPSQKYPKITHTLCEMSFQNNMAACNPIYSMTGGSAHAQLTRSKLYVHPDNDSSALVCSGDEEAKAALIWDASTGLLIDTLKAEAPVLDLIAFRDSHRTLLSTLTDKHLRVYTWTC